MASSAGGNTNFTGQQPQTTAPAVVLQQYALCLQQPRPGLNVVTIPLIMYGGWSVHTRQWVRGIHG